MPPLPGAITKYRGITIGAVTMIAAGTSAWDCRLGVVITALTWIWAVLTTPRGWGVQLEGAAVSWAYRVMERAASAR